MLEPRRWNERIKLPGSIPDKIWAKCPVCGSGGDYPASALTGADSQSNIVTDSVGEYLVWHEGELMCQRCKTNRIHRAESHIAAEKHSHAQAFRDAVGFKKTVS